MSFLAPLFFARPGRARHAGADPSDSARAQERRRVSVADVRAQDSVFVDPAAAHSQLGAAAAAPRRARADRRGVRAPVPAQPDARRPRRAARATSSSCSIAPTAWATAISGTARGARRTTRSASSVDGDRGTLVLFSSTAEVAVQPTNDRARLQSEITAATLSAGATRYRAGAEARRQPARGVEPAAARSGARSATSSAAAGRLATGCGCRPAPSLTPVPIAAGAARNLAVTPVTMQRDQSSGQERVTVTGGRAQSQRRSRHRIPVSLEIDGHVAQTARVSVQPQRFELDDVPAGDVSARRTRAASCASATTRWPRDNAFYFVLSPPRPVKSRLGGGRGGARRRRCISRARWRSATARASRSALRASTHSATRCWTDPRRDPQRREPGRRARQRA